tara:strand:+ start:72 stop:371 length:300 start_codon:yes stop_codon:yes gene_type:complete
MVLQVSESGYRLPDVQTLTHVSKLSIVNDKPIMMDYWVTSVEKKALIGVREGGEKLLVKNEEEYTSPISKVFKVKTDFIIETENSFYLVDSEIETKKIS